MKKQIRPMTIEDIDAVFAIEMLAHRAPWTRDILRDCVLVHYDCRVLEWPEQQAEQIIGYLVCRYDHDLCHILNICIAPDAQNTGYGSLLLRDLFDSLSAALIKSVILEVRPSNHAALHLYQKLGFQQIDVKREYYSDEQGLEDAIVLRKTLPGQK